MIVLRNCWALFYLCDYNWLSRILINDFSVEFSIYRALIKSHYVLSEGPSLVRKNILYLPQLLVEGSSSSFGRSIVVLVVHLLVPID